MSSLTRVPTFVNQWMYGSKTFDCLFEEEARSVEVIGSVGDWRAMQSIGLMS